MTPSVGLASSFSVGSSGSIISPVILYRRALSIIMQLPPEIQFTSIPMATSPSLDVSNVSLLVVHFAEAKNPLFPCTKLSATVSLPAFIENEDEALLAYPVRWSIVNKYLPAGRFLIVCVTEVEPFDHPIRR